MSRRQQLLKLTKRGIGVLIGLVLKLEAQLQALRGQIQQLKDQLALTSRNSGKPPSSGGLAKPPRLPSLRQKPDANPENSGAIGDAPCNPCPRPTISSFIR